MPLHVLGDVTKQSPAHDRIDIRTANEIVERVPTPVHASNVEPNARSLREQPQLDP